MTSLGLRQAQARFHDWMVGDALPVWADIGRDAPGLGFREHLTLQGMPDGVPFKRMRVQARQIYVFSHAHSLGFTAGADLAADALRFITANGLRADGAWVRRLTRDGRILDPVADLYDISFVLFALAWFARATGDRAALAQARMTVEWVRATMAAPGGGYYNTIPIEPGYRQQNPHMHLLEAALALFETSPEQLFADLAREMMTLFRRHFLHAETGTLGEFFDADLSPILGDAGTHVEPGHQYEWVWLLDRYHRLLGENVDAEINQLYRFTQTYGHDSTGIAVVDVLGRDGSVRAASSRLWPQTEALKAHAAMLRRGAANESQIASGVTYLLDRYLTGCPRGMWHDQLAGVAGSNVADKIPASSLYHLFMAYAELDRLVAPPDVGTVGESPRFD